MVTTATATVVPDGSGDDGGMVRSLRLWNYFTMGFGAIIGTGWVLLVGDWMIVGGGPFEAMIAFVLGAVFLLPIGSASGAVTTAGSFLPGVLAALVMTPFFYTGFDTIPQSAEEASEGLDWKKFGMVISASLLAAGLFYVFCIYAFGTIFPWKQAVVMPVPALASIEKISLWFYLPMLVIGTLGPIGPMNSFYGAAARLMLAMGRKGYLPNGFATIDRKTGTPKTANIVLAVATVIGPFLGGNLLIPLPEVSSLSFMFACTMAAVACMKMRWSEPDLPRPYTVPGGKFGIGLAIAAGVIIIGLQVLPFSPAALKPMSWVIVAVWIVLGLALRWISVRSRRA